MDEKTLKKLREFGLIMALAFTLLSGLFFWREKPQTATILLIVAAPFLTLGILRPQLLAPLERVWMKFSEKLSVLMTFLIVTLTFYLVITPMGVVMRLFGADLLSLKIDKNADSYWVAVDNENGPSTRPFRPY